MKSTEGKGLTLSELGEQLNWYSEAVSKGVRATALGIIAAIWAISTADGLTVNSTGLFGIHTDTAVRLAFFFSGAALLVNLIKDAATYFMTSKGFDLYEATVESVDEASFEYDEPHLGKFGFFLYRMNPVLFRIQLALVVLGASTFFTLVFGISILSAIPAVGGE